MFIEDRHRKIVETILKHYPYHFYAFGSRVKGTQKKFSDLDLCYIDEIPFRELRKIFDEFEESDLPYKVDFVNLNKCSDDFQEKIKREMIPFN